ncbi:bifunctional diaminohydroxyphosphoribosylaminopyrimidine deaminase/5-amino-6-(5-phosphoribosylamino)uracil reductase RibD [Salicibibacter halophilus]|uniref:Riboflavin biosynthesis protein RibD n=1 Tax=Salicibibacter halophilus TaxID=2502791 RepID=A0A514LIY5_9BACI|nr:bifunctional diaminohydroxyphosphoribosylaminopyrimidine deaminase/5-amino-6-(5-phosphoribosylamino)uracil reductase RibD [Salicibibacter halophilus]QDI91802.1 bifunctional diaminohydroxyphosphoribosylaminopyrimidine deaminase/5-amino-6-(5-phosphoribosylamino)uracil reductase RibD [Salicibibacter halophilus]
MNDDWYMQHALDLAAAMEGQTSPNPMVGAVIVKNGRIVGTGAHMGAGEAHAEVHALKMAEGRTGGATMYVTLEPCNHHGRTPPCSEKIIEAGIARVVVAAKDVNPEVAGSGIEALRNAGVETEVGVLEEKAEKLNAAFFHYVQTGKPYVTVKTASTLNGAMTSPKGVSPWITGKAALAEVHQLRHIHDVILVGVETALNDNPALTTRLEIEGRNPIRVVLDRHLRTPLAAQLVTDGKAPTWIFTEESRESNHASALEQKGARVISMSTITAKSVLEELGRADIQTVLVEGGQTIISAFIAENQVQRYISYVAPKLFSADAANTELEVEHTQMVGGDIKITATTKKGDASCSQG